MPGWTTEQGGAGDIIGLNLVSSQLIQETSLEVEHTSATTGVVVRRLHNNFMEK
jgi:hypothetical protein